MSAPSNGALISDRRALIGSNLSISFENEGGLHMVRGVGTYLYTDTGEVYLDCVNNVSHVGHSNAHVNACIQQQQQRINTNSRYLSTSLQQYASRLLGTFPSPLSHGKVFFVASGSESNDLAMRICRAYARSKTDALLTSIPAAERASMRETESSREIFVCLSYAYHGATNSIIEISPYKYRSKHGRGKASHIIEVGIPESFEGPEMEAELTKLQDSLNAARAKGHSICGFYAESVLSCAGQVFLPPHFLQRIYGLVRDAGGLCIADEVQTGFARMGCYWGFQTQQVMPDIVTTGKGIGNGYPMAAVIVREEVAQSFAGMEYFNSCAGTNTSAQVGLAVLDCIDAWKLVEHGARVGQALKHELHQLQREFPILFDVRGEGLFLGIEIRTDQPSIIRQQQQRRREEIQKQNNNNVKQVISDSTTYSIQMSRLPQQALPVCARLSAAAASSISATPCDLSCGDVCGWLSSALMLCRPMGVLTGTDGPLHNVLKLKPPMVFSLRDAHYFCQALRECLKQLVQLHPCLALLNSQTPQMKSKL